VFYAQCFCNDCSSPRTAASFVVNPLPNPAITGNILVCQGATETYTTSSNAGSSYVWSLSGGGTINPVSNNATIVWSGLENSGPYTITVTETDANGCSKSNTLLVKIKGNTLSCLGTVNATLNANCRTTLTPNTFLTSLINGATWMRIELLSLGDLVLESGVGSIVIDGLSPSGTPYPYVGQRLKYRITEPCTGNICWGYVNLEDKTPPTITCPLDLTISCAQVNAGAGSTLDVSGSPQVTDCSSFATTYNDLVFEQTCTNPFTALPAGIGAPHVLPATGDIVKIIKRIFTATDAGGYASTCEQIIYVRKANISNVICPSDISFNCINTNDLSPTGAGAPKLDIDGDLTTLYDRVAINAASCSIDANFTDLRINLCAGSYKLIRTWTILDWCAPRAQGINPRTCVQTISVMDLTPPTVSASYSQFYINNGNTYSRDTTTSFDGYFISSTPAQSSTGTVSQVYPLGNSSVCGGKARFTIRASDPNCTNGQISITSNDSRYLVVGTPQYNPISHLTTVVFEANYTSLGTYPVTFTAADSCGAAVAKKTFNVVIKDNIAPQAICHGVTADLSSDGHVSINWASINERSYDNCGPVVIDIRRMNSCTGAPLNDPYTANVDFSCCDAGATGLMVQIRVTDQAGNINYCMAPVTIQNKLRPTCIAPISTSISCSDLPNLGNNFNAYGNASFWYNCSDTTITYRIDTLLDNCKIGAFTRTWTIRAGNGFSNSSPCTQTINVTGKSDFTVDFPDDIVLTCAAAIPTKESLRLQMLNPANWNVTDGAIKNDGCGVLGVQIADDTITSDPSSCLKILRRITVIDWCRYNPNNNLTDPNRNCYGRPVEGDTHGYLNLGSTAGNLGTWEYLNPDRPAGVSPQDRRFRDADGLTSNIPGFTSSNTTNPQLNPYNDGIICFTQIIKVIDRVAPTFTPVADKTVCDYGTTGATTLLCNGAYTDAISATDLCAGTTLGSGITYRWRIFRASNNSQIVPLTGYNTGTAITANLDFNTDYLIKAEAEDRCGNIGYLQYHVTMTDCKRPTIICHDVNPNLILTANNTAGFAQVWATDVLASPLFDNCTAQAYLNSKLVIRRIDDNMHGAHSAYPLLATDYDGRSVSFSCTDYRNAPNHTIDVELWTKDEAGNASFCTAHIRIQDNGNICNPSIQAAVSGAVQTEQADYVQNVTVSAYNASTMMGTATTCTGGPTCLSPGLYSIAGLTTGANLQMRANRNDNPLNGVTTYDIALVSKHILGTESLSSPYKMIAADVNKDGDITGVDMLQMRKLILHIIPAFPSNESWRFVDRAYQFVNPLNPLAEAFNEVINLTTIPVAAQANFLAIKIGDVNGSSIANGLVSGNAGLMHGKVGTLILSTDDIKLESGQEYTTTIATTDLAVEGYQFTAHFKNGTVKILDLDKGNLTNMTESNFGRFENDITTSWNGVQTSINDVTPASGVSKLMTIRYRALVGAPLSEILSISSELTKAEAYSPSGAPMKVQLTYNNQQNSNISEEFALYQNSPNPVNEVTTIGFNLPIPTSATLSIYDVSGKLIKTLTADYNSGYQELMVSKEELGSSGVYYYRLDAGAYTATRKLVFVGR
jgi:Secretion system C-terminal sorting domain/Dockerin type I domain/PKD-like domain